VRRSERDDGRKTGTRQRCAPPSALWRAHSHGVFSYTACACHPPAPPPSIPQGHGSDTPGEEGEGRRHTSSSTASSSSSYGRFSGFRPPTDGASSKIASAAVGASVAGGSIGSSMPSSSNPISLLRRSLLDRRFFRLNKKLIFEQRVWGGDDLAPAFSLVGSGEPRCIPLGLSDKKLSPGPPGLSLVVTALAYALVRWNDGMMLL
jgi:hypothetical protein